jgi:GntR family transcriptional repressor for pyruvate dehydrogenase complex
MPSALRRIKKPKLTETVVDRLAAAIRDGEFAPGEKLPTERELGERFGVSRNVVREAVNELRTRGLITTRQGSGSVVSDDIHKPVRQVMEDLLTGRDGAEGKLIELRRILEVHIAALAAERATRADIEGMERILKDFDAAGADLARCAELDVAFHQALCRAAHNELFGVVVEPLNELLTATRRRALQRSGMETAARSHGALLVAIRSHDSALAAHCMTEHMDLTQEAWRKTRKGADA